jgi:hypothetical protein
MKPIIIKCVGVVEPEPEPAGFRSGVGRMEGLMKQQLNSN